MATGKGGDMASRIRILVLAGAGIWFGVAGADEPITNPPPDELRQFSFMLGARDCIGNWRLSDSVIKPFRASWHGSEILSGHMVVEEYRAWDADGVVFIHGANTRTYNALDRRWTTRWQSVIDGSSFELGQPRFEERNDGTRVVTFINGEGDDLQRAIYTEYPDGRLAWRGDSTVDAGQTWDIAVMTIECGTPRR